MARRREYPLRIVVNGVQITKVIIDPHYEENHAESITDKIVIELVKTLDGLSVLPEVVKEPFSYFAQDGIEMGGKLYKLIWLLEDDEIYVGVINAYRRKK
jgi:hypothetical protein